MGDEIQRYVVSERNGRGAYMGENSGGDYVKYVDHTAVLDAQRSKTLEEVAAFKCVLAARLINPAPVDERFSLNEVEDAFDATLASLEDHQVDDQQGGEPDEGPVCSCGHSIAEHHMAANPATAPEHMDGPIYPCGKCGCKEFDFDPTPGASEGSGGGDTFQRVIDSSGESGAPLQAPGDGKCCTNCVEVKPDVVTLPDWCGAGPMDLCPKCICLLYDAKQPIGLGDEDRRLVEVAATLVHAIQLERPTHVTVEDQADAYRFLRKLPSKDYQVDEPEEGTEADVRAVERIADELVGRESLYNEEGEQLEQHWPMVDDLAWSLYRLSGAPGFRRRLDDHPAQEQGKGTEEI